MYNNNRNNPQKLYFKKKCQGYSAFNNKSFFRPLDVANLVFPSLDEFEQFIVLFSRNPKVVSEGNIGIIISAGRLGAPLTQLGGIVLTYNSLFYVDLCHL